MIVARWIPVAFTLVLTTLCMAAPVGAQDQAPARRFALSTEMEVQAEIGLAKGRRLLSLRSEQGDAMLMRLRADGKPDPAFGPLGLRSAGLTRGARSVALLAGGRDDFWMLSAADNRDQGWRLQYHGDDGELREFWSLDIAHVADHAHLHRMRDGSVLVMPYPVDRLQVWRIKRGSAVTRMERPLGGTGDALVEVVQTLDAQGRVFLLGEVLVPGNPVRRETLVACWTGSGLLDPAFGEDGMSRLRFFDDDPQTRPRALYAALGDALQVEVEIGTAGYSEPAWIQVDALGRNRSPELGINRGLGRPPAHIEAPRHLGMGGFR